MYYCVVENCRSVWHPNTTIKFHSFPKDIIKRNSWLSIVPLKGKFYASAKICSVHFKPEDYDPGRPGLLLKSAAPFCSPQACDCASTPSTSTEVPNDMKNHMKCQATRSVKRVLHPECTQSNFNCQIGRRKSLPSTPVLENIKKPKIMLQEVEESKAEENMANTKARQENVCFCCLTENNTMIRLGSCQHKKVLQEFIQSEFQNVMICNICHMMLKKIVIFKQQVVECSKMLYNRSNNLLRPKKLYNLQRSQTMVTNNIIASEQEVNIKQEPEDEEYMVENIYNEEESKDKKVTLKQEVESSLDESVNDAEETIDEEFMDNDEGSFNNDEVSMRDNEDGLDNDGQDKTSNEDNMENHKKVMKNKCKQQKTNRNQDVKSINNQISIDFTHFEVENEIPIELDFNQIETNRDPLKLPQQAENFSSGIKKEPFSVFNLSLRQLLLQKSRLPMNNQIELPEAYIEFPVTNSILSQSSSLQQQNSPMHENLLIECSPKTTQIPQGDEDKYNGKVKVVMLDREDITAEREKKYKNLNYVKSRNKCVTCVRSFPNKKELTKHNELFHRQDESHECEICEMKIDPESYEKHLNIHRKRFDCEICGERSNDLSKISQHFNEKHGKEYGLIDMIYKCTDCNFASDKRNTFYYHKGQHKKQRCPICDRRIISMYLLDIHLVTVHDITQKKFSCPTCDITFKKHSRLTRHLISYPRHQKYESACDQCDETFSDESFLEAHVNWKHSKPKCIHCHREFEEFAHMRRHIRIHHKKKKKAPTKVCNHCGKLFGTLKTLTDHIRTHTGERPFKCSTCGATFKQSGALFTHNKLKHS